MGLFDMPEINSPHRTPRTVLTSSVVWKGCSTQSQMSTC